jgi:hypothetical protein
MGIVTNGKPLQLTFISRQSIEHQRSIADTFGSRQIDDALTQIGLSQGEIRQRL